MGLILVFEVSLHSVVEVFGYKAKEAEEGHGEGEKDGEGAADVHEFG